MSLIPHHPLFQSYLGVSSDISQIIPPKVMLRQDVPFWVDEIGANVQPKIQHETMFHEVNLVPAIERWDDAISNLALNPISPIGVGKEKFAQIIVETLMEAIYSIWKVDYSHVVLCSGGYDSRLIAYVIRKLWEEHGDTWLGETTFLEVEGEYGAAKQYMEAIGWGEARLVICRDIKPETKEYHADDLDFEMAWQKTAGGMWARGFNYWYDPVLWLQRQGVIPTDLSLIQGFTGVLANEVGLTSIGGKGIEWFVRNMPYHVYALAPCLGEWISPYMDTSFIHAVAQYGQGHDPYFRRVVIETVAPKVGQIYNPRSGSGPYRELSDRLKERIVNSYHNSWYGERFPNFKSPDTVNFSRGWGLWGLASFCEYLRGKGHEIV